MPTQLTTTTVSGGLGFGLQNKIASLWDGTFIWIDSSSGTTATLYQITSPGGTPSNSSVKSFTISSSTNVVGDIFVVNNGNSTNDVWVYYGSNGTTLSANVAHGTYNASGVWSWDNNGTALPSVSGSLALGSIVWTGTNLIVALRDNPSSTNHVRLTYTTTKSGSSGWQAYGLLDSAGSGSNSHYDPLLLHDSTLAATIAVYTVADKVVARVLDDAQTPAVANWGSEVTIQATPNNIGAANLTAYFDTTNQQLYVAWCDSTSGTGFSPALITSSSVTVNGTSSTIAFNSKISIASSTTATSPHLAMSNGGTLYLFWATSTSGSASDIEYVSVTTPYGSGQVSSVTNQTNSSASNNVLPHVPHRERLSVTYMPLLYETGTASPFGIQYDNSISLPNTAHRTVSATAALQATLTRTVPATGALQSLDQSRTVPGTVALQSLGISRTIPETAALQATGQSRTVPGTAALQATLTRTVPATGALQSLNLSRTISATAALTLSVTVRSIPETAALTSLGLSRTLLSSAALLSTLTRTLPSSGALFSTLTRPLPASAALDSLGIFRTVAGTAALQSLGLQRVLPASGAITFTFSRTLPTTGALQSTFTRTILASASVAFAGTGIGPLSTSVRTQTWVNSGSGQETDISYLDATNSGWRVGAIPAYGGAVIAPWYEVNSSVETNGNQTSLTTTNPDGSTNPDGWTHELSHANSNVFGGGAYDGSESYSYTTLGLQEQNPVGTDFRRYYKAQVRNGSAAGSGLVWTVFSCIYPGDPGLIVDRIDATNPTGSAISLNNSSDSLGLALIGGLKSDTATPAGSWGSANSGYGSVGGTTHTPVPTSNTSGEPDFFWVTPDSATGQLIGVGAVKGTKLGSGGLGWSSVTFLLAQNTNRVKIHIDGTFTSFPANTTQTIYVLRVLRRSLTSAFMAAIAADFLNPGSPTATVGAFTAWRIDERAFEFAASLNQVTGQLDLSPANVTVRYKPILKLTNWTSPAIPALVWNGVNLTQNVDYRATVDTINQIAYVQLYFDVVSSGAGNGQKNNAVFAIAPTLTQRTLAASATLQSLSLQRVITADSALQSTLSRVVPSVGALSSLSLQRTLPVTGALSSLALSRTILETAALQSLGLSRTLPATGAVLSTLSRTISASVALQGGNSRNLPASVALLSTLSRQIPASASLNAFTIRTVPASVTLSSTLSRTLPATGALQSTLARTLPASASLLLGGTRSLPATAALQSTLTRSLPASASLALAGAAGAINPTLLGRDGKVVLKGRDGKVTLVGR